MTLLLGPRVESWALEAITPQGERIASLPLVEGSGRHDWSLTAANPSSMTATLGDRLADGAALPDWGDVWLRGVYRCNGEPHILGTWVASKAPTKLTATRRTTTLTGYDPTVLLSRAALRSGITYPQGTPIAETVQSLIALYTPAVSASIGDTDDTLRVALSFNVGTPVLTVCNKLLEAAVYRPLSPTRAGQIFTARWQPYEQRPTVGTFGHDDYHLLYLPDVTADDNLLSRPDQVTAEGKGGQDADPIIGMWPEYAIPNGVSVHITTEASDAPAVVLAARRHYEESRARSLTAPITGPWQPVKPGEVLGWRWDRHGVDVRAELMSLSSQWARKSPTTYQLREVPA